MSEPVVIVGCGGHGRELLGIIAAINACVAAPGPTKLGSWPVLGSWRVLGFVDDKPSTANLARLDRLAVPLLGPVDWLAELSGVHVTIGVGDPRVRREIDARIGGFGLPAARLVHPAATLGEDTVAGDGLVAFAGARVTTNVTLGRHVHLNQNCTVGHDCVLGDYVSVNPLAAVSGECHLDAGVLVGTTAAVLQGRRVGAGAVVGAGACVVRDVAAHTTVTGVPAHR